MYCGDILLLYFDMLNNNIFSILEFFWSGRFNCAAINIGRIMVFSLNYDMEGLSTDQKYYMSG